MFCYRLSLLMLLFALTSCSQWLTHQLSVSRTLSSTPEEPVFTVYHNIRPSRRAGGAVREIKFKTPKSLKEIAFEFVNYKVRIKKIDFVNSSGKIIALPGFSPSLLSSKKKFITLRNLPKHDDIISVRIYAEGFSDDDVIFTTSFFSPQGFLASEKGEGSFKVSTSMKSAANLQIPICLQTQKSLAGVLFDLEKINQLEVSEKRYFCQYFLKEFSTFLQTYPDVSQFLRLGENLEKPLVVLGRKFAYDRFKNEVSFPLLLQKKDFVSLIDDFTASTQTSKYPAGRSVSQAFDKSRSSVDGMSYDDYMDTGTQSVSYLEYRDEWSFEEEDSTPHQCAAFMNDLGIPKSLAQRNCEDISGFEQGHIACMQELSDLYIMTSHIHNYCLDARGKLAFYQPCMKKMTEMNFTHYDAHHFCRRTPEDFLGGQIQCLEVMISQGFSQNDAIKTCQRKWGRESSLMVCLDEQKNLITDQKSRSAFCLSR